MLASQLISAFRTLVIVAVSSSVGLELIAQPATSNSSPNVILIVSDDQGYGDVGLHGNKDLRTPYLDRFAQEGVRVDRFYASPICSASRASILTGKYSHRTGVPYATRGGEVLRPRELTVAEVLKKAGYSTALVGKWHLGRYQKYGPLAQGFDDFFGFRDGMLANYRDAILEYNGTPVRSNGFITDVFTDEAIRFVETKRNNPFFLYLAYNAPHIPLQVPQHFEDEYLKAGLPGNLSKLYGMITHLDASVGRLLQRLRELDLEDSTVVFFLSDNGMQKGNVAHRVSPESRRLEAMWVGVDRFNAGLREQKGTVYEGGVRVPFFARWPGHFRTGKRVGSFAAHIDILPTILDLCRISDFDRSKLDGQSLASQLLGEEDRPVRESLFFWCDAAVFDNSPQVKYPRSTWAVRTGSWKLVKGTELYNLEQDPGEEHNVIHSHPKLAEKLRRSFDQWSQTLMPKEDLTRLPVPITGEDTPSFGSNMFAGGTVLELEWVNLHGDGLRYAYDKNIRDRITDWNRQDQYLSWNIDVEKEGTYEVILTYGCSPKDAGSRIRISGGGETIEGSLRATPATDVWREWKAGRLRLRGGTTTLEIRPLSVPGQLVMDLREVRLRLKEEN